MFQLGSDLTMNGDISQLTIYSSNLAELKAQRNNESKVKYRILEPAKLDLIVKMSEEEQKLLVKLSDISVSIAPAPIRTLLAVTSSLSSVQSEVQEEKTLVSSRNLFSPKETSSDCFWFIRKERRSSLSEQQSNAEKIVAPTTKKIRQNLLFDLETIELKFEVGLGFVTKAVFAMCLSDLTVEAHDWSSDMRFSSTLSVEAALYNENFLAWEPLIEPLIDEKSGRLSPWHFCCSMMPALPASSLDESEDLQQKQDNAKSVLTVRADRLLNLTLSRSGLQLVQRLSSLFNDFVNRRAPPAEDDEDESLLSLVNATGQEITVDQLNGIKFLHGNNTQMVLKTNEKVALDLIRENQRGVRLSVIDNQERRKRQEFRVQFGEYEKTVMIDRSPPSCFTLRPSGLDKWPVTLTCFTQVENDRRIVVLSSIVRLNNRSTVGLVVLDPKSIEKKNSRPISSVQVNEIGFVPLSGIYSTSMTPVFIAIDENENPNPDYFLFDIVNDYNVDRKLTTSDGQTIHFTIFKEIVYGYNENSNDFGRPTILLHIHSTLQLTNLLPIDISYIVTNKENLGQKTQPIPMSPSQIDLIPQGNKSSSLKFIIPSYQNDEWVSNLVDLSTQGKGDYNEHPVIFRCSSNEQILRLILRVETLHDSYRLLLYSSYWLINRTELALQFQIDSIETSIPYVDAPFLVSSDKFGTAESKKGRVRVGNETGWSEQIPMAVISSVDMTCSKRNDGFSYFICVSITTSSFGLTRLVTFSPSFAVINRSTIPLEIFDHSSKDVNNKWTVIEENQIQSLWCRTIKDNTLSVRYQHNQVESRPFKIDQPHRTLLKMNDEQRSALFVEVIESDAKSLRIIFHDYKVGDAPLLVINRLTEDITLTQTDDSTNQMLPSMYHTHYTWNDPTKPRKLVVSRGSKSFVIDPVYGPNPENFPLKYRIFNDASQTILLINPEDPSVKFDKESEINSISEANGLRLELRMADLGISLVNDSEHEELVYISLTKSKIIWTESTRSRTKPINKELAEKLEKLYKKHAESLEIHPEDTTLREKKYQLDEITVFFNETGAILAYARGKLRPVSRKSIEGLWLNYFTSPKKTTIHLQLNRIQIDNQLDRTVFPVLLHPVQPKTTSSEYTHKPFVEMSIIQTVEESSKITNFEYFTVLIQEFAVKIEQGFIVAILAFMAADNSHLSGTLNMNSDLEQVKKTLQTIIESQILSPSNEQQMMFSNLHLSPLKMHISFSMHGNKPSEELLTGFPLVTFLLRTLNIAEVQDVLLRMGYFERNGQQLTFTQIYKEVYSHYSSQFLKQIHVLLLGLDVLGNPFGVIRGLAGGVESFFYEPYKGIVEGPAEFAVGVGTGVKSLLGSAVGGAAGAASKITGSIGKGLVQLTFDEEYKASRTRQKDPNAGAMSEIAVGGKNVLMGFVDGVTGVVTKPIDEAKKSGITGFFKGIGKGAVGLIARPTVGIVDFASTSMDVVKRTAQDENIVRRARYPRHIGLDRLIRPYIPHEASGFYILNRLNDGEYSNTDVYFGHVECSHQPPSYLIATSKRVVFVTEISFLGSYDIDWVFTYDEISEPPTVGSDPSSIQILTKNKIPSSLLSKTRYNAYEDIDHEPKRTGTLKSKRTYGKLIHCRNDKDAKFMVHKLNDALHFARN